MNNSSFLSDNISFNTKYKVQPEQKFISDKTQVQENSFEIKEYNKNVNKDCIIKSAISKKWSIKFK